VRTVSLTFLRLLPRWNPTEVIPKTVSLMRQTFPPFSPAGAGPSARLFLRRLGVCLGTTEGPRGTEERLHHNARKLCQIFSSRSAFCPDDCVARVARGSRVLFNASGTTIHSFAKLAIDTRASAERGKCEATAFLSKTSSGVPIGVILATRVPPLARTQASLRPAASGRQPPPLGLRPKSFFVR
jgi:hypothetical protein